MSGGDLCSTACGFSSGQIEQHHMGASGREDRSVMIAQEPSPPCDDGYAAREVEELLYTI
jgi:hypothetical protein